MKRPVILSTPSGLPLREAILRDGTRYPVRAWTGGQSPVVCPLVRQLRTAFFREQVEEWRAFWEDNPDAPTLRLFFNRATHDAFATLHH